MTEEDQMLVAMAALHGARFVRDEDGLWKVENLPNGWKYTIGRAAEQYLLDVGIRSLSQHWDYDARTFSSLNGPQEVDPAFIASVLA